MNEIVIGLGDAACKVLSKMSFSRCLTDEGPIEAGLFILITAAGLGILYLLRSANEPA